MLLLHNADIRTMHAAMPRADAVIIDGGRFTYVGSLDGARLMLSGRRYVAMDAEGCTVTPGFNDAHMHLAHTAMRDLRVILTGTRSVQELQARLREGLASASNGWLIGEGWNQDAFDDRRLLTRADLDAVSTELPIVATRVCGHILAANSRALAIAGVDVADGILREDEQGAIWAKVPPIHADQLVRAICGAEKRLFQQGLTSVQSDDLGSVPDGEEEALLRGIRDAGDAGRLRVRYAAQALCGSLPSMRGFFSKSLQRLRGERFRMAHMKLLGDGSLGARTAWLSAPYADAPETSGMRIYTDDALRDLVGEAAGHGMPVAIHAIGDAAAQQVLDTLRSAGGTGLRHAIVHAQIMNAAQVAACGTMGLVIMAQPIFLAADAPIVRARVGDALADTSYRWRSMLGMGAHVAFGTDSPVEPFDTLPNLYCAITRHAPGESLPYLPDEAFGMDEALYAYTAAGAYASGEEAEKGRIWPGMAADLVRLDRRLDDRLPEQLLEARVLETYIGGEPVYRA
ncbi:amidohydrolase [Eubacteriales bacterium OttesenSCG-928-A19]|nr:amidohydrolase [Eubacteriales bacterium OttesenSCG-928-A19]